MGAGESKTPLFDGGKRVDGRSPEELRALKFTRAFTKYAEGSVLVEFGETKVLCNATVEFSLAVSFLHLTVRLVVVWCGSHQTALSIIPSLLTSRFRAKSIRSSFNLTTRSSLAASSTA